MRCVCSTLVDGLLAYRGARVVKEDSNSISIDGQFYDPYSNTPCGFWNEWKGLVREHVIMKVQENKVVEYKHGADFVIFSYNCGILY